MTILRNVKSLQLGRRSFLRGLGGVSIGLPFLECMLDSKRARAQGMPRRFAMIYAGQSTGFAQPIQFEPSDFGTAFTTTVGTAALNGEHGDLRGDVSLVTGLRIPYAGSNNADDVPPTGRVAGFHDSTRGPLISGVRAYSQDDVSGPSADWLLAPTLGRNPLIVRAQAEPYRGGEGRGRISFRDDNGNLAGQDPYVSPRQVWQSLFQGLTPQDPVEAERERLRIQRDQSVLDLVRGSSERLRNRLGVRDRQRLELHFEALRELELRVDAVSPPAIGICERPIDPGADPTVVVVSDDVVGVDMDGNLRDIGFGREDLRARLMADFVHMAFACGVENNVSFQVSFGQTFINSNFVTGLNTDIHELSHYSGGVSGVQDSAQINHAKSVNWHVDTFAYLASKLKGTDEGDGTLLDHTAMVLLFEGGWGYDPESGQGSDDDPRAHSSENMSVLVAGRAGGLRPQGHIRVAGGHPAQALLSCMRGVGYEGSLGEVDNELTELF
jgi:Protein of unknown function (DUF1552)